MTDVPSSFWAGLNFHCWTALIACAVRPKGAAFSTWIVPALPSAVITTPRTTKPLYFRRAGDVGVFRVWTINTAGHSGARNARSQHSGFVRKHLWLAGIIGTVLVEKLLRLLGRGEPREFVQVARPFALLIGQAKACQVNLYRDQAVFFIYGSQNDASCSQTRSDN